ncbi:hypothetical protein JZ751_016406 [Albula glossodonta]|uniref:Uncharacterized protein n=1 Tax=Albula glossodonta TaxID=121402 RepID=A0A8T2NQM6_9TELE|nr:hypothetical protein JZ751_016406 [Albula glossodonta]
MLWILGLRPSKLKLREGERKREQGGEREKERERHTGSLRKHSSVEIYSLQAQLINMGVIPTLVKLLGIHSQNTALTEMCLIAFGNLAELESSKEQFACTSVAEELVALFRKQTEHEKREVIFEVLAPLAENGEALHITLTHLFTLQPWTRKSPIP